MHPLIHHIVEAAVDEGGMEGVVLHDLEYLQINCGLLSLRSLETLGEWMPNLKTLQTVLGVGSVAAICGQWPLLEKLVGMHGSILTDEDIIGNCEEAQEKKGLVDFAELKTFHLHAACDEGRLTDRVAHLAFLKMCKLTDLQICVSDKFTLQAEELLKDCILNVLVIRNYFGNEEHENWNCCKNTEWMQVLHESNFEGSDCSVTPSPTPDATDTESEDDVFDDDDFETDREEEDEEGEKEETGEQSSEKGKEKSHDEDGGDSELKDSDKGTEKSDGQGGNNAGNALYADEKNEMKESNEEIE